MEADRFLGYVLGSGGAVDLDHHPLATWVVTRPFTELVAWPSTGAVLRGCARRRRSADADRRGPGRTRPRGSAATGRNAFQ
ncbi:hypothetical protein Q7689_16520 [Nocardiopsis tropica]|uniref:hypothetical protein n=1 Tax=Nocardiopsis tropica TaxID=109330 RepID=UPI002E89D123|nr:hypothetical protein [Nocardiopsis tropica]